MGNKSRIPPRTLAKIHRLPSDERREYVQELKGRYEQKLRHLHKASKAQWEEWANNQRDHFEQIVVELDELMEA